MKPERFKKLRMYLPRQPLANQRPWQIAGLLLAAAFLLFAAWSYFNYNKNQCLPHGQQKSNFKRY